METPTLMLTGLTLELREWGPDKGTLIGHASFAERGNQITIKLDHEAARKIVELCASGIVETAQRMATQISAQVLLQVPQALEDRS